MTKFTHAEIDQLPPLVARQNGDVWDVVTPNGTIVGGGLTEKGARLMAAAPGMLRFIAGFFHRTNAPARIDAGNVLGRLSIEIVDG